MRSPVEGSRVHCAYFLEWALINFHCSLEYRPSARGGNFILFCYTTLFKSRQGWMRCLQYFLSFVEFRSEQNDINYNRDDKVLSVLAWLTNTNHSRNLHGGFITLQRDDGLGLYSTLGA